MNWYKFKLEHDNGTHNVTVNGTSVETARKTLMEYEGCPQRAVLGYYQPEIAGRTITTERAREIAGQWHGGQWSGLYQFASSGIFVPQSILHYLHEVQHGGIDAPELALHPYSLTVKDRSELESLLRYFLKRAQENDIAIFWKYHSQYGYIYPTVTDKYFNLEDWYPVVSSSNEGECVLKIGNKLVAFYSIDLEFNNV